MTEPTRNSTVTLQEINKDTLRPILSLEVAETQKKFVAPNAVSVAQAYFQRDRAWFRGIYADETPVGFLMLYDDPGEPVYFLWRFMIDARYQGMGYGRRAIELLVEHVKTRPMATELKVSYVPGEGSPGLFYAKMGFVETGEVEHGENIMSLKLEYPAGQSPVPAGGNPVTHIVMVKLKDPTPANIEETIEKIRGMEGKIEELKALEVGKDIPHKQTLSEAGLLGLVVPKAYGGLGGSLRDLCAATFAMGTACPSTALAYFFHCSSVSRGLLGLEAVAAGAFADEAEATAVKTFSEKVLNKMGYERKLLGNFASESAKSSQSAVHISSEATLTDGGWRLNGVKSFGCNTGVADEYLVAAKLAGCETADGLALFFVQADADGVQEQGALDDKKLD